MTAGRTDLPHPARAVAIRPGRRAGAIAALTGTAAVLLGAAALVGLTAPPASAHPLGNFTVNRYAGLQISTDLVVVDYVVDRAEIPTFQARDQVDVNRDGRLSPSELAAFGQGDCASAAGGLHLADAGQAIRLSVVTGTAGLRPGQAGLPTLRTTCTLDGRLRDTHRTAVLTVLDTSDAGHIGWHEMTAVGDGTTVTGLPRSSVSDRLTHYPTGMLHAPLDVRQADVRVVPGGPRLVEGAATAATAGTGQPAPRGLDPLSRRFTELVGRQRLTVGFALVAVALATVLGGLHAFAPGHGKTVMAAYIVNGRGGLRAVTTIGLTVTATHTLGVLLLGVVVSTSASLASERVLPALGAVSGAMLAAVGVGLLLGARRRTLARSDVPHHHDHAIAQHHEQHHEQRHPQPPEHAHGPREEHRHEHPHGHLHTHPHEHSHGHQHEQDSDPGTPHRHGFVTHTHAPRPSGEPRRRSLLAMGLAGGLVPSPSALVVLLGAVALHRTWFGVLLVACYGLGMAATMTGIGLGLSRARGAVTRASWRGNRLMAVAEQTLPVATAAVVTVVGVSLALRGLGAALALG